MATWKANTPSTTNLLPGKVAAAPPPQCLCLESLSKSSSATLNSINCNLAQVPPSAMDSVGTSSSNNEEREERRRAARPATRDSSPGTVSSRPTHDDAAQANPGQHEPFPNGAPGVKRRTSAVEAVVSLTEDNRGFLNPEYSKDSSDDDEADREEDSMLSSDAEAVAYVHAPSQAIFPLTADERHAVRRAHEAYVNAAATAGNANNLMTLLRELHAKAQEAANRPASGGMSAFPSAEELLQKAETCLGTVRFRNVMSASERRRSGACDPATAEGAVFTLEDAFCFLGVLKFELVSHLFDGKSSSGGSSANTGSSSRQSGAGSPTPVAKSSLIGAGRADSRPRLSSSEATSPAPPLPATAAAAAQQAPPQAPVPSSPVKAATSSVLAASRLAFPPSSASHKAIARPAPSTSSSGVTTTPTAAAAAESGSPSPSSPPLPGAKANLHVPSSLSLSLPKTHDSRRSGGGSSNNNMKRTRQHRAAPSTPDASGVNSPDDALCCDVALRAYVERKAFAELAEGRDSSQRRIRYERLIEALQLFELALNPAAVARVCGSGSGVRLGASDDLAGEYINLATFVKIMEAGLQQPLDGSRNASQRARRVSGEGGETGPDMFRLVLLTEATAAHADGAPFTSATAFSTDDDICAERGAVAAATTAPETNATASPRNEGGSGSSLIDSFASSKSVPVNAASGAAAATSVNRSVSHSRSTSSVVASAVGFTRSASDTDDAYPITLTENSAMATLCREIRRRLRSAVHKNVSEHAESQLSGEKAGAKDAVLPPPPPPLPPPLPSLQRTTSTSVVASTGMPVSSTPSSSYVASPPSHPSHSSRQASAGLRRRVSSSTSCFGVATQASPSGRSGGQQATSSASPPPPHSRLHADAPAEPQQPDPRTRHKHPRRLSAPQSGPAQNALKQWQREMVPPPAAAQWTAPHPYGPTTITSAQVAAAAVAATAVVAAAELAQRCPPRSSHSRPRNGSGRDRVNAVVKRDGSALTYPHYMRRCSQPPYRPTLPFNGASQPTASRPNRLVTRPAVTTAAAAGGGSSVPRQHSSRPFHETSSAARSPARPLLRRPSRWEQIAALSPYFVAPPRQPPSPPPSRRCDGDVYAHLTSTTGLLWRQGRFAEGDTATAAAAVTTESVEAAWAPQMTLSSAHVPLRPRRLPSATAAATAVSSPLLLLPQTGRHQRPSPAPAIPLQQPPQRPQDRRGVEVAQGHCHGSDRAPQSTTEQRAQPMGEATAHASNTASTAPPTTTTLLPVLFPQQQRRESVLSELAELYAKHKALTRCLASLSTSATVSSQQTCQQEAMECEVALNDVSRRIHHCLAELAVGSAVMSDRDMSSPLPPPSDGSACGDHPTAAFLEKAEAWRREELLAYTIAEACQAAFVSAQRMTSQCAGPPPVMDRSSPRPPLAPANAGIAGNTVVGQEVSSLMPFASVSSAPDKSYVTVTPFSTSDTPSDSRLSVNGADQAQQQQQQPQPQSQQLEKSSHEASRKSDGHTCAHPQTTSLQVSSTVPPLLNCNASATDESQLNFKGSFSSPSWNSFQASTAQPGAESVHSRLTQPPLQLPATLALDESNTRLAYLSGPRLVQSSANAADSPERFTASDADAQAMTRLSPDPLTSDDAKTSRTSAAQPEPMTLSSKVTTSKGVAAVPAAVAATLPSAPQAFSTEDRKSTSTAPSGTTLNSSSAPLTLRASPYSPPMIRPRGSSSSATTGTPTTTTTSLSSAAVVAAAALGLHGAASSITTTTTAAAMRAAGAMYDDDSPSPRANFYLEWAVTQPEQRQRLLQGGDNTGTNDHQAHTSGSTTNSFTALVKSVFLPYSSGSSVHSALVHPPPTSFSSATAATTGTTATTSTSWVASRVFCAPGMFARPPMGANRSTTSSGRALPNSLNVSKLGSGGSEAGLASVLTERQSHSLPMPLTTESDATHNDDRPSHGPDSISTLTDEAPLLGYSAGDCTALLRRGLAAVGNSHGQTSTTVGNLTNTSLGGNNSISQLAGASAPLEFLGSTTRSRIGAQALRSGLNSSIFRTTRSTARQYGGSAENQHSYSVFERTESSIIPAGFSGSMFPQRDADGNVIHEHE